MTTPAKLRNLLPTCLVLASFAAAQPADLHSRIDTIARRALASTGVPSASIAVVQDGKVTYLQAYGQARLDPPTAAKPAMCYSIGSISKQFTATAILLLAEQGKLSLDDPVGRYVPNLTRGNEVTIRQILSHTSGYQDFWPQDYVPPFMNEPITADKILDLWARKPLDFEPGTQWQYSNTGFVIAGLVVEKASGMPLLDFLSKYIFTPLDMKSVMNIDQNRLTETDATGYLRYALGPPRIAPKEGKGWLFAAGELAMPAEDLAKWDISLINQTVLKPASYHEMETEVVLKNGLGTRYGLGVQVRQEFGRRAIEHGGEVSGFTAHNMVFPDERVAVVVLTNQDSIDAAGDIARKIAPLLFPRDDATREEQQSRAIFEGLQQGKINRALFTDNANAYFTAQALKDFAASLGPLGALLEFTQTARQDRGGMTFRGFDVKFAEKTVEVWERIMPDGKIEQYQVAGKD
ncbi:MAG TPA: serine hydrolase domain-containing protein [Terriglobales bacterium]|jgi:CubicO group peptidase (beta-lactamase class C family)|nr:serine hydrolase domain-containing protein [Terriglobales bacterium]